eukprot:284818572_3
MILLLQRVSLQTTRLCSPGPTARGGRSQRGDGMDGFVCDVFLRIVSGLAVNKRPKRPSLYGTPIARKAQQPSFSTCLQCSRELRTLDITFYLNHLRVYVCLLLATFQFTLLLSLLQNQVSRFSLPCRCRAVVVWPRFVGMSSSHFREANFCCIGFRQGLAAASRIHYPHLLRVSYLASASSCGLRLSALFSVWHVRLSNVFRCCSSFYTKHILFFSLEFWESSWVISPFPRHSYLGLLAK